MKKHSVIISGHQTSLSLEPEFWNELKEIAENRKVPLSHLIEQVDNKRRTNLSSAIRVYVLSTLKQKIVNNK
jgi:predicted DNA-binding ribbon-helix-helix protein